MSLTDSSLTLLSYTPELQPYFERFNKAWLNKYFAVEPVDEYVLTQPEAALLKDGGAILFAQYQGTVIGCVALKQLGNGLMELTKMAVDENYQGLGGGKFLCAAAVDRARELGASRLILYSQSQLGPALAIYRKLGFIDIPLEAGKYKRADVMMALDL
ncbi:MAG: GNAT family N-acetyltransferase [Candidatus Pseudobacter hemicellulosilyticus]|uniref:GNAT family N-acetyltransferase n=1 Tax=Candidatus Pseudobacter hemicellulosilyticus TaxID=3121375 RepID=A0AAJ6BE79_9BACT|nr:MAG: GNAT family N-acetyltransferase [Pseudobacter sp.]